MADKYFSMGVQNVGSEYVLLFEVPKNADGAFISGLYVANVTDKNTFVEIILTREGTEVHLTSSETPLPCGSTLAIATPGQSLHMGTSDTIKIRCRRNESADAYIVGTLLNLKPDEPAGSTFCEEFIKNYIK